VSDDRITPPSRSLRSVVFGDIFDIANTLTREVLLSDMKVYIMKIYSVSFNNLVVGVVQDKVPGVGDPDATLREFAGRLEHLAYPVTSVELAPGDPYVSFSKSTVSLDEPSSVTVTMRQSSEGNAVAL